MDLQLQDYAGPVPEVCEGWEEEVSFLCWLGFHKFSTRSKPRQLGAAREGWMYHTHKCRRKGCGIISWDPLPLNCKLCPQKKGH